MLRRLSLTVLGFCCLLFAIAGPAGAQTTQDQNASQNGGTKEATEEQGGGLSITATKVKLTFGGFIEATGIYRDKNTGADVNSNWNFGSGGFMLPDVPNYYMNQLTFSSRQSRLSLLVQGKEEFANLAAYYETDFLGGGTGTASNYKESNSYLLRTRLLYATYDAPDTGWHLLAGQAWSLVTQERMGLLPHNENIVMTIDAQYVPGFTWTRNVQLRLVKDFGSAFSAGLSVEGPQALVTAGGLTALAGAANPYTYNLGGGNYAYTGNTTVNSNEPSPISLDMLPDVIGKIALDPGFGHYELYGLARFFTDRTDIGGSFNNETTVGWGGGAALQVPIIPKYLDIRGSALVGQGIGRYGSGQMNDVVVNPGNGKLDPIPEVEALVGIVVHPIDRLDVYGYGGLEQEFATDVTGTNGGYGNTSAFYYPAGILTEAPTGIPTAFVQANGIEQATVGFWYSVAKGDFGQLRLGASYAYTRLFTFGTPDEAINTVMLSLRYYW